jgi:hypothetical protein
VEHLPRRILSAVGERRKRRLKRKDRIRVDADVENDLDDVAENISANWSKTDTGKVGSKVRDWVKPDGAGAGDSLAELTSAYDFYKLFQSDSYVEQVRYFKYSLFYFFLYRYLLNITQVV